MSATTNNQTVTIQPKEPKKEYIIKPVWQELTPEEKKNNEEIEKEVGKSMFDPISDIWTYKKVEKKTRTKDGYTVKEEMQATNLTEKIHANARLIKEANVAETVKELERQQKELEELTK